MGIARIRKLHQLGEPVFKGTRRREKPDPIKCSDCGREINAREGTGLCGRCATIAHRVATTGSPNKRLINQPSRHTRRARKGSAA